MPLLPVKSNEAFPNQKVGLVSWMRSCRLHKNNILLLVVAAASSSAGELAWKPKRGVHSCGKLKHLLSSVQRLSCREPQVYEQAFKLCGDERALQEAKQIHSNMIVHGIQAAHGPVLGSKIVAAYAKCGSLGDAFLAFEQIQTKTLFCWNALLIACSSHGCDAHVLDLFRQMMSLGTRPGKHTYPCVLKACAGSGQSWEFLARQLHASALRNGLNLGVFVGNALVSMYAKFGLVTDACLVFEQIRDKDVVSWNALISGYAHNGLFGKTIEVFNRMMMQQQQQQQDQVRLKPNAVTMAAVLPACAYLGDLELGKRIHDLIRFTGIEADLLLWNALLTFYCKCSRLQDARQVFDAMLVRDVVSWNAIISGYAQSGNYNEALKLINKMGKERQKPNVTTWNGLIAGYARNKEYAEALKLLIDMQVRYKEKPNSVTVTSALPVCAHIAALEKGREIHAYVTKTDLQLNVCVGTALIDMYTKCGSLQDARKVFQRSSHRNVVLWTAIISGHAVHGHGHEALALYDEMQGGGLKPDSITFTALLSACSHAGLVDEGWQCFKSISTDHGMTPCLEQHACMVDLLCRAGSLDEAAEFVRNMPLQPDAGIYGTLLAASRIHCNVELGEAAAKKLFDMEPQNPGNYVLLANLYYETGRLDDASRVRKLMKDRGVTKNPGCSWIEVQNKVHVFLVADRSHPDTDKIYSLLQKLHRLMKMEGYWPNKKYDSEDGCSAAVCNSVA